MFPKSWITPSWLILSLDLVAAIASWKAALLLRLNFDLIAFNNYRTAGILSMILVVTFSLSLLLRTYKGIVRHTGITDMYKIIFLNFASSVIYLNVIAIDTSWINAKTFPPSLILTNFFICAFVHVSYRLLTKRVFKYHSTYRKLKRSRAAIYNTGYSGLMVHEAISNAPDINIKIVAFLENKSTHTGKSIKGIPIYNTRSSQLKKLITQEKITQIIIAEEEIENTILNKLVEVCMAHNVQVKKVLPPKTWINDDPKRIKLQDINIEDLLGRSVIHINNLLLKIELKDKRILVTGAAGSIGSEIVRQLIQYKPAVIILCDKAESPLYELELEVQELNTGVSVITYIGNVCDVVRMQQLFEIYAPSIIYHAAAYKHVPLMETHPSIAVVNNVLGAKIMAELAVEYKAEKFVMVSTDKAVNPTNVMGASKRIAEIYIQSYHNHIASQYNKNIDSENSETGPTRFITTRFGNVLGSNGSVIPRFKIQIEKGGPLTVTHPEITRYFMTIQEACQLLLEASIMGNGGEIFVFDMGKPVKIADLARKIIKMSGKEPDKDIKIVYTGLRPGEKLYEELLTNAENTLPTYHEKIMIAKVRNYDFPNVQVTVNKLIEYAQNHYTTQTVLLMKQLVPEFISKNSVFEELDKNKIVL